jgi:transposase InsO family protein
MTKEEKQTVAVFRFGVIHDFVSGIKLDPGEQEKLLQQKCERKWVIPYSDKTGISRSTILRWVQLYRDSGGRLESLESCKRSDQGKARVLDEETSLSLMRLRKEMPGIPVPLFLETAKQRRIIAPGGELSLSTLYRFLHHHHLMEKPANRPVDRRKFEAELPNDLWQSDVMHGPKLRVGNTLKKTYLIAFIDDHSRLIPHGEFYPSESLACFSNALEQALLKRGLPRKLYVDNGSAYRSRQLEYTCASLGIALIHARPYMPQGKGKIERFHRTVRSELLSGFKGQTLREINEAFDLWVNGKYHQRKHSSTSQSPFKRFTSHMECIRTAPADLKDHFRKTVKRRVNKDRSIVINKRLYEAPVELIGKRVEVLFHEDSPEEAEVKWRQKSYGMLTMIDLHVNCRVKRDKNNQIELSAGEPRPERGRLWEDQ